MKLLGRIVIILLAALAVSGATYELGQAGLLSAVGAGRGEGRPGGFAGAPNQAPNAAPSAQRQPTAGFEGRGRDEGGFSLFGLTELGKAFGTTAVVVVLVAPVVSLIQWRKRARRKAMAVGRSSSA